MTIRTIADILTGIALVANWVLLARLLRQRRRLDRAVLSALEAETAAWRNLEAQEASWRLMARRFAEWADRADG